MFFGSGRERSRKIRKVCQYLAEPRTGGKICILSIERVIHPSTSEAQKNSEEVVGDSPKS